MFLVGRVVYGEQKVDRLWPLMQVLRVPMIGHPLLGPWFGALGIAHEVICNDKSSDSTLLDVCA